MPDPAHREDLTRAVDQPLRDLSVVREEAPPVLRRAAAAPYDLASVSDCTTAAGELTELDAALGPDLAPGAKGEGVTIHGLAADLIGGAVGLPFRGVVRRVTGAETRDQALRAAVLAGMVRRGFIKGRMGALGCAPRAPSLSTR